MYCKNIQGCKNEVQQLNLYWFAFCIVTYRNLSAAKSILLGIHVRTLAEELWYQRQTTISPESAPHLTKMSQGNLSDDSQRFCINRE